MPRSTAWCPRCSTTTAPIRRRSPIRFRPASLARRVTDYLAGMTDRLLHPGLRAAHRAGRVRAVTRYTADSTDRVRDAVDMIALVSARTDLRRAGVNSYFGICPFHDERTASFHVRPDEKHYHCFGCQVSGDPFTFVMETEGLDFKTALESLARALRRHARDRGRGPGRGLSTGAPRTALHAARPGRDLLRPATCGTPARRRRRGSTSAAAA